MASKYTFIEPHEDNYWRVIELVRDMDNIYNELCNRFSKYESIWTSHYRDMLQVCSRLQDNLRRACLLDQCWYCVKSRRDECNHLNNVFECQICMKVLSNGKPFNLEDLMQIISSIETEKKFTENSRSLN